MLVGGPVCGQPGAANSPTKAADSTRQQANDAADQVANQEIYYVKSVAQDFASPLGVVHCQAQPLCVAQRFSLIPRENLSDIPARRRRRRPSACCSTTFPPLTPAASRGTWACPLARWRWRTSGNAPRLAHLAVFWETRLGLSAAHCDAVIGESVALGLARSLERECAMLRARIRLLEEAGDFGAANASLYATR